MTKTTPAPFDLAAIDTIAACNKPKTVEIRHPVTKAKTGLFLLMLGRDSDVYRGRVRAIANERIQGTSDADLDAAEAKSIDAICAANVGWWTEIDGKKVGDFFTLDGVQLEHNLANQRLVFTRILPAREQAQVAINELSGFLPE